MTDRSSTHPASLHEPQAAAGPNPTTDRRPARRPVRRVDFIDPDVVDRIASIGYARAPEEACGVLVPLIGGSGYVVEVPNQADDPREMFSFDWSAAVEAVGGVESELSDQVDLAPGDCVDLIVWHTHPNGHVGPSRRDVRVKAELFPEQRCLIVALRDGAGIASLF